MAKIHFGIIAVLNFLAGYASTDDATHVKVKGNRKSVSYRVHLGITASLDDPHFQAPASTETGVTGAACIQSCALAGREGAECVGVEYGWITGQCNRLFFGYNQRVGKENPYMINIIVDRSQSLRSIVADATGAKSVNILMASHCNTIYLGYRHNAQVLKTVAPSGTGIDARSCVLACHEKVDCTAVNFDWVNYQCELLATGAQVSDQMMGKQMASYIHILVPEVNLAPGEGVGSTGCTVM